MGERALLASIIYRRKRDLYAPQPAKIWVRLALIYGRPQFVIFAFACLLGTTVLSGRLFAQAIPAQASNQRADSDVYAQIGCLPPLYQNAARQHVPLQKAMAIVRYLPKLSADDCFVDMIGIVAQVTEGESFVFSRLDAEPSGATRTLLFKVLYNRALGLPYTTDPLPSDSQLRVVEVHASSDSDIDASLEALAALRAFHAAAEARLFKEREELPANRSDAAAGKALETTHLRYYSWFSGTRLPDFAYVPPVRFSVVASGKPIRVLAFGDFGTGTDGQMKTASVMRAYCLKYKVDFGIILGDNFYRAQDGSRVNSPYSPRWYSQWEELYGGMGIKFYPVFGNNDYVDPDSPAAELDYTDHSKTWDFPAPFYTFTAGSAQFFAIDNIRLSSDELDWLDRELGRSTAGWKIVYGHYPIHAAGSDGEHAELITKLLPILEKNHVQIYLSGHVHSMQDIQTDSPVHFYVSGAGGAGLASDLNATYKKSMFKTATFGFTVLEIDERHADVIFVDSDGKETYRSHLTQ
jgi:hypothetical protein